MVLVANQLRPMPASGSLDEVSLTFQGHRMTTLVY